MIARLPDELFYELPDDLKGKLWGGKYLGQRQTWFLARFTGSDADVNIATGHPEFSHWKWVEPRYLPDLIVPFKRDLYRAILDGFSKHL